VRYRYGVFEAERCVIQKAHLRARAAKGAGSRLEEERTRAEESRNSISPAKARPERALMRQCGPRRRSMLRAVGAEVVGSVEALDGLGLEGDVFVIGGAEVYGLLLERCESVYLTVLAGPAEGDAFMPVFEEAFPVMEVNEVQAGVAEWRRYRRG